jgi:ATP-dependent helicase/nuclease subunit B
MGTSAPVETDAWLRDGGVVVTASDRAARALTAAYNRARQSEGLTAWAAPKITNWNNFVREAWTERSLDDRLLLNPRQEESLWAEIAGREQHPATLLDGPRQRIAVLAMEAHDLLASHAPAYLRSAARGAWQQDAEVFSGWLKNLDQVCRDGKLLSASRVPLELIALLPESASVMRPPLLVAGFDRILPVQRSLFDAWGAWREAAKGEPAAEVRYYCAPDAQAELAACAIWCQRRLAGDRHKRLLIVAQDVAGLRGEIERALLKHTSSGGPPMFEFSLGVPLIQVPLAKAAHLLLRWLSGPLEETEVDWLLSTGRAPAADGEIAMVQRAMRELRRRGEQRTAWTLDAFCGQKAVSKFAPAAWVERMKAAQQRLANAAARPQSPMDFAVLVPLLLKAAAWPGSEPLTSTEFQAANRWQQAVEACGSLGFDNRQIHWREFMGVLSRALDDTLFAPESRDAPIQVAGPAESAGLSADAVWFLGADENEWPASGSTNPFLPLHVQREGAMPHATAQLDWNLARAITARLLAAAPEVNFSYAKQKQGVETRPARLVAEVAGEPQPLPAELASRAAPEPLTIPFNDFSRVPFTLTTLAGGASVLTAQSQCPFKAFATSRLNAKGWDPAMAGLSPPQRGQLVHAVMHAVWGGKPRGIRSLDELRDLPDRKAFVEGHVDRVLREQIPAGVRERMPRRYLELEGSRLINLVTEWLDYEAVRLPFSVSQTEADRPIELAGLHFRVRLDRIDRLNDDSLLVIDYKTGDVSPNLWDMPRPDDVQLPLYSGFALDRAEEPLGGLAFAKLRAGERHREFAGRIFQPAETLFGGLKASNALVKNWLTLEQLSAWREYIERLAQDFVAGRAEADPRDYPTTCEHCELPVLCRIHETREPIGAGDETGDEDTADE